jgi:hypothetical protein
MSRQRSILQVPLFPKSEEWRIFWSFRTCVSVSLACFLLLYPFTASTLLKHISPEFVMFVTVMVKDITLGATLVNSWACTFGSFLGSLLSFIVLIILDEIAQSVSNSILMNFITLLFLFFSVFILQYFETQPLGKKVGVSLLAQNILLFNKQQSNLENQLGVWEFFVSTLLGCACGIVGTLFPPPIRLAGIEVKERLQFATANVEALFEATLTAWIQTPFQYSTEDSSTRMMNTAPIHHTLRQQIPSPSTLVLLLPKKQSKHWRNIRLIFQVIFAFRRSHLYHLSWKYQSTSSYYYKDRYHRVELIKYLQEELEILVQRNKEARFGPSRWMSINVFSRYLRLIRNFLSILLLLQKKVSALEYQQEYYEIYMKFFNHPDFRRCLYHWIRCIGLNLDLLQELCLQSSSVSKEKVLSLKEKTHMLQKQRNFVTNMIRAKEEFDLMYFRLRKLIYYGVEDSIRFDDKSTPILTASVTVLLNMHPIFFLVETTSDSIVQFLIEVEMEIFQQLEQHQEQPSIKSSSSSQSVNRMNHPLEIIGDTNKNDNDEENDIEINSHEDSEEHQKSSSFITLLYESTISCCIDLYRTARDWSNDLFPSQRHILCCIISPLPSSLQQQSTIATLFCSLKCLFNPTILQRMKHAFTVALAMTLAGLYGLAATRPQVALASFTIAYLTGGTVSSINLLTCINRAAGTVVACVYTVIIVYIHNLDGLQHGDHSSVGKTLFLACAIVLFQIPCTYLRSFPLYSYSGTVAGFTAALLLINQQQLSTDVAINRIIDTYVALFIYLSIELSFFAIRSEETNSID